MKKYSILYLMTLFVFLMARAASAQDFLICQQTLNSVLFSLSADPKAQPELRVDAAGFAGLSPILAPVSLVNEEKGKFSDPIKFSVNGEIKISHGNLDALLLSTSDRQIQIALAVDIVDSTGEEAIQN